MKLNINKIAKSLDERRSLLTASRRELEALLESDGPDLIKARPSAAALERRCRASIVESLELYHRLGEDLYPLLTQMRALANLIKTQARLGAEHRRICSLVEPILECGKAPGSNQAD